MWLRKRPRQVRAEATIGGWRALLRRRVWLLVGVPLVTAGLFWSVLALLDRPIRQVEVVGPFLRVAPPQIEQAVLMFCKAEHRRHAGLMSLDLAALKAAIESIAWIDRVRIERRWPDKLRVTVIEQIPGARWGERGLLNARGELFLRDARFVPPELPQLNGPDGTESQVARLYLEVYPRLATVGLRLSRVTLDARGAWELTVSSAQPSAGNTDGVVVRLGRQDVAARLERFLAAASPLLATRAGEVSYIDMRYSNGFAVGWRAGSQSLADKTLPKRSPDA